jgi:hypothetical protein
VFVAPALFGLNGAGVSAASEAVTSFSAWLEGSGLKIAPLVQRQP